MDNQYGTSSGPIRPPPGLSIKEFVPSSSAAGKPFGGPQAPSFTSRAQPTGPPAGARKPPPQQINPYSSSGGPPRRQPSPVTVPDPHGLPEGDDDILGFAAPSSGNSAKELSSQAAEMFRSFKPFPQQPPAAGPPQPGGPSLGPPPGIGGFMPVTQQQKHMQHGGGGGRGRGGGSYNPNIGGPPSSTMGGGRGGFGPNSAGGPPQRGRGRGRGGRGRGGGPPMGPGLTRPSVSAYSVSHGRMQLAGQFTSETLRQDMQQRCYLQSATLDEESLTAAGLPSMVQQYHTLCPLEDPTAAGEHPSVALGVASYVFKGIHSGDGAAYCLRRLDGRQVLPTAELYEAADAVVERWTPLSNHPSVVGLREVFVSDEIDAVPAVFLSYDYYPGALTLEQAHMLPTHTPQGLMRNPVTESQLWSYLVQLTGALRAIHSAGLVASPASLAPSKVLLMAPGRVRVGAVGVSEVFAEGPPADVARGQREDLTGLGTLLLTIGCAAKNSPPSLEALSATFSRELCHVIAGLVASAEGSGFSSWRSLISALGDRVFTELESNQNQIDTLTTDFMKESENGRIARFIIKLNMVLERSELMGDTRWAETADRYLLSLFRDFVFHQVNENGAPEMDWGTVIEAINKADAGVEEKIMLLSRDEASMLVVSYADLKRCLMTAYGELKAAARSGGGGGMGMSSGNPYR